MPTDNSVVIVNWVDREFLFAMETVLRKRGFAKREDYEQHGTQTQVWEKAPNKSVDAKLISQDRVDLTFVESKVVTT